MSKKRIRTCCLVIDASVAFAAGDWESQAPESILCRDFLNAVRGAGHRVAWSRAVEAEWDKHQSPFAAQWRTSMLNLRKLRPVTGEILDELREAVAGHSSDRNVVRIMLKDAHLIEAALATDRRIAAGDETARGHFGRLAPTLDLIRLVNWVNPTIDDEHMIEWIEQGAPLQRSRRLTPPV